MLILTMPGKISAEPGAQEKQLNEEVTKYSQAEIPL
jgi:hypothetical protein